jgi:hypothetical protein
MIAAAAKSFLRTMIGRRSGVLSLESDPNRRVQTDASDACHHFGAAQVERDLRSKIRRGEARC